MTLRLSRFSRTLGHRSGHIARHAAVAGARLRGHSRIPVGLLAPLGGAAGPVCSTRRPLRRVGALAVAAVTALAMVVFVPAASADGTVSVSNSTDLAAAFTQANTGATVTALLTKSFADVGGSYILARGSLTIDLGGNSFTVTGPAGQPALTVAAGASFRVEDGGTAAFAGGVGASGANTPEPDSVLAAADGANGTPGEPTGGKGDAGIVAGQPGGNGGAGAAATDDVGGNGGDGGNGGPGANGGNGGHGGASVYTTQLAFYVEAVSGGFGGVGGTGLTGGNGSGGAAGIVIAGVVVVSGATLNGEGGDGGNGGIGGWGGDGGNGGNGGDLTTTGNTPTIASHGGNGGTGGKGGDGGNGGDGGVGIDLQSGILLTDSASQLTTLGGKAGDHGPAGRGGLGGGAGHSGLINGVAPAPADALPGVAGQQGDPGADGNSGADGHPLAGTADSPVGWEVAANGDHAADAPYNDMVVLHANDRTQSAWRLVAWRPEIGHTGPTLGAVSATLDTVAFPSYAGHTLIGWSTSPDGSSGLLPDSTPVVTPENGVTDYYAQWKVGSNSNTGGAESGGGAGTASTPGATDRVSGSNRYATAEAIAEAFGTASAVVVANGTDAKDGADALAANYLAGRAHAPILLTEAGTVPAATLAAVKQVLAGAGNATIYVMGGTDSVSDAAAAAIKAAAATAASGTVMVVRVAGSNRDQTAALAAQKVGPVGSVTITKAGAAAKTAILTSGTSNADALAAAPISYAMGVPVLLTGGTTLDPSVKAAIGKLGIIQLLVLGGPDRVTPAAVTATGIPADRVVRIAGANRYATSAQLFTFALTVMGFNDGAKTDTYLGNALGGFPDVLAAGPLAGSTDAAVLTVGQAGLDTAVQTYRKAHSTANVTALGGPDRVTPAQITQARTLANS